MFSCLKKQVKCDKPTYSDDYEKSGTAGKKWAYYVKKYVKVYASSHFKSLEMCIEKRKGIQWKYSNSAELEQVNSTGEVLEWANRASFFFFCFLIDF